MYTSPNPKRDAVVMLLHTFDIQKGGSSQQEGWTALARKLSADGYHVLSFDFRGFGDSKTVTDRFWDPKYQHNTQLIQGGAIAAAKKAELIDHRKFTVAYLPYLLNDIAAAKAYLDRRNDAGQVNSGNVILIGAGEGAALGALWLKNECRRRRDTNVPPGIIPTLASQSEINDIAGAVWLSIHPTFSQKVSTSVKGAIVEAGKNHKVPMAFVYGKNDSKAASLAQQYVQAIKGSVKGKGKLTVTYAVAGTKLSGNKLLGVDDTDKKIIKDYLELVMDARGNREQKDRKSEASAYWYIYPATKRQYRLSKIGGRESPQVDLSIVFGY
jgi:hypothetical protein